MKTTQAPGAPGIAPRWTSAAKDGVGTAYSKDANLWFTLSHGIVNEVYFPHVDTPNVRDLQFLITDGETFCHEEKRDLIHEMEYPEENTLLHRITSSDPAGRYRLIKEIIVEPHSPVLLMRVRLELSDKSLHGKIRLFALCAPHMKGTGSHNSAWLCESCGRSIIRAERGDSEMALGCQPDFLRRSVGFVGVSDGWTDLMGNFSMDWAYTDALDGNVACIGEIDLTEEHEFTLGLGFGRSKHGASTHLLQAFATPFAELRQKFVRQWRRTLPAGEDWSADTGDDGSMLRLSRCVLLTHEDKLFQGAFVASLSIPWGEIKDDSDFGGYHLVWARDMVQTATALIASASGGSESALRALIWLGCVQDDDGGMPQNTFINGVPYWTGIQLDEVAAPVLLAWRLHREKALRQFDPQPLALRAARYLIVHGPVTVQERWEENSGYSPSTLATVIAALVIAAEFSRDARDSASADFLLAHADWISSHLEEWMVTSCGDLVEGKPRHYLRITPADPGNPIAAPDPDHAEIQIANGGGRHLARRIVGGDFLHLVRLGVRAAEDPVIVESLAVIDQVVRRELPQGPAWRRYNFDGYGQKADGGAFDGTGEGRCWPILTGERAHYELAAGREVMPFIRTLESFANDGGMIPEQLWDAEDLADGGMRRGGPTGAAMPLCWSHAEYISLVRSRRDGVCFDRIEPVYQRYVEGGRGCDFEIWTFAHQLQHIARGKTLRLILEADARVSWSADGWASNHEIDAMLIPALDLWHADLGADEIPAPGCLVEFTFLWKESQRREERHFSVRVGDHKG